MATNVQSVSVLAQDTTTEITTTPWAWMNFLVTASRLYRYSFSDQLLIHAQRPDATACASFELWKNTMHRYVKKGSKGIALLDDRGGYPRLRYVFDVSDTGELPNKSRSPNLWELSGRHVPPVTFMLEQEYGAADAPLYEQLIEVAESLAAEYWQDHEGEVLEAMESSLYDELDAYTIETEFTATLAASLAYTLCNRCGLDVEQIFDAEDFPHLYNFSTMQAVTCLGTATSELAEPVLMEIGRTIKRIDRGLVAENERSNDNERNHLQAERGLPDTQPDTGPATQPDAGQVRPDVAESLEKPPDAEVQRPSVIRFLADYAKRSGRDDTAADRADGGRAGGEEPAARQVQQPAGVDGPHEQPESASGGIDTDRPHLQQISLFPTEQETIAEIAEADTPASAIPISGDEIDAILLYHGNTSYNIKFEIVEYMEAHGRERGAASFLKEHYGVYMKNRLVSGGDTFGYYTEKGLTVGRGDVGNPDEETTLKWPKVQARVLKLINEGRFLGLLEQVEYQEWKKDRDAARPQGAEHPQPVRDNAPPVAQPEPEPEDKNDVSPAQAGAEQPQGRMYAERDVVYLDGGAAYIITNIGHRVHLELAAGQDVTGVPAGQSMSRASFERELERNPKNRHFTDYLAADLQAVDDDMVDVLENGLLDVQTKATIADLLGKGATNGDIANIIIQACGTDANTMELETGDTADFFTNVDGIQVDILDKFATKKSMSWLEVAAAVRSLAAGWEPEPPAQEQAGPGRMCGVGDTVYLDGKAYTITTMDTNVRLLDVETAQAGNPVHISVPRQNLYNRLSWDERNKPYLDYYAEHPADVDGDLRQVVAHMTRRPERQAAVAQLLETNCTNAQLGLGLSELFILHSMMELENGYTATYMAVENGIEVSLDNGDTFSFSWLDMAPIVRGMAEGWGREPTPELADEPQAEEAGPVEIPIGTELEIDGRRFRVDSVNYDWNTVSLQDVTFQSAVGFPIFRSESIDFVLQYWQPLAEQEHRPPEPSTEVVDAPPPTKPVPPPAAQATGQVPVNFTITDDAHGTGGAKTKYRANVDAIRTLKTIEAENRLATPEEQTVLSGFVGWGGLPGAFTPDHPDWVKEYTELQELLTPEEYRRAKASTMNAHYTPPVVIRAIYDAVEGMGFKQGNILEPACGSGNFFGMLPEGMQDSKLYGVELDSITGRIAQQLYQKANIAVCGFEKTELPNAFFDVAVGNVPFGGYKVADREYDRLNYNIHDYFFAKTFDKVRPGGVVAFITTSGTLDKKNPEVRKYLAQRGELIGAVRLPNNAFKANAGTEVTADILFFQKRDRQMDVEPDWVHLGQTPDGIPINSYFAENPHMILGRMEYDASMYGNEKDTTCRPIEGANLAEQLQEAIGHIHAEIEDVSLDDIPELEQERESIPADPDVKNYSFTILDGEIYYRENSRMYRRELPKATAERVKHMVELRDTVQRIIQYQLIDTPDTILQREQARLNRLYDSFTSKYGLINSRGNNLAFSDDSAYYLLCSLEVLDEAGELERKADMFTKRTIKRREPVTHVDTAAEALAVSIGEKACVDLGFMHTLSGLSHEQIVADLEGVIYRVPAMDADTTPITDAQWQTADEYLSGNVREKLGLARGYAEYYPGLFEKNVEALEAAQPKELEAQEISVRLGVEWIGTEYVQQFMQHLLEPGEYEQDITVKQFGYNGEWTITGSRASYPDNVLANVTYGTERVSGYRLLENALNQRETRVYDLVKDNGSERRVLNRKQTMLAQQKQEAIKEAFKDWIFDDAQRRQDLVEKYNVLYNSTKPREYDGSHIIFHGMNPDIEMKPHQRDAVAHGLYGDNVLFAHEVGAGKTFEMIALAMESKRLGLTSKSMITVPNHLTEQTAAEFLRLYPSANILVARKKDFETKNRKKFCARIATGDYDAVIIGHSQFQKIPISRERQERLINEQVEEIAEGIAEIKASKGERIWIKRLEQTKKSLETRLERLTDASRKDDVVTFEELGVDRLFVDESHNHKNLFLYTKMRNVAGLSTADAQKSSDLFLKCQYLDELTGGKGIVFATGTPVSNSMTELYTIMRYLMYNRLMAEGFKHFDTWAAQYGETTTAIELAPEGTGYRARTRFSRFHNLPELMNLLKEVADFKTADMLDLPTPKATYHVEVVQPSEIQQAMVKELSARATKIHDGHVDPRDDNMLKITSDGRKIGLDQRLIDPSLPDSPGSKVNACVGNVHRVWQDTKAQRSTQLIFCDIATPNKDGRFNVYDDIKAKLMARGIPEQEIAFIHDANTEVQKQALFAKVRRGQVRVLLGSTPMMGTGANVQDKLVALHDLDCPWRPSDLAQRAGRIVRQGNENKEVDIFRYVTEKTFDAYLWQTVENKQKFIAQIMTSRTPLRSCEDLDETALSFAEIKALCAGDPLVKEKTDLELDIRKLRVLKADYQSQHYKLEDNLHTHYPRRIKSAEAYIAKLESDTKRLAENTHPNDKGFSPMVVGKKEYTDKEQAGKALLLACRSIKLGKEAWYSDPVKLGIYRGMDMEVAAVREHGTREVNFRLTLAGAIRYNVELGGDVMGNITRINNELARIPNSIEENKAEIVEVEKQIAAAKTELARPFIHDAELEQKVARLAEVDSLLDLDKSEPELTPDDEPEDGAAEPPEREYIGRMAVATSGERAGAVVANARPSILSQLKERIPTSPPPGKAKAAADISI